VLSLFLRAITGSAAPWALCAALTLGALPLRAQAPDFAEPWRWSRFGIEAGLPSDGIVRITESRDGTPWVATTDGIAWFDGYQWHSVLRQPFDSSMERAPIIAARPEGGIVAVAGGMLLTGDTAGLRARPLRVGDRRLTVMDARSMPEGGIMVLALDSTAQLFRLAADTLVPLEAPGLLSRQSSTLWGGESGDVFLNTSRGVFAWHEGHWEIVEASGRRPGDILAFTAAGGHVLFYRSGAKAPGLYEIRASRSRRLVSEGIQRAVALAQSSSGPVLAAYEAGDIRYRPRGSWMSLEPAPEGLRDVTTLRFRANGDLWAGTRHGLYLYHRSSRRWTGSSYPFPDLRNRINAIARGRDGTVWLATGGGLVARRPDGREHTWVSAAGIKLGAVTAVAVDAAGHVWVGSGGSFLGAVRWDGTRWQYFGPAQGLATNVHRINVGRDGRLWFLGLGDRSDSLTRGAYRFQDGRFALWSRDSLARGVRVYDFAEGADGAYWFATGRGLLRWHTGRWTTWTRFPWTNGQRVFTVETDQAGRAWFSDQNTGAGYVDSRDSLHHVTAADGLVDNRVWEIRQADDGRLWFATTAGIGFLREGLWSRFGTEEGLPAPHVWAIAPESSQVLLGTLGRGLWTLSLGEEDSPPIVRLAPPAILENGVQARWQPLSFWGRTPQARIRTRYRVDNGDWSAWSTARETDVDAASGRHRLDVEALSLFGRVSRTASITFSVPAPLYRQPEFLVPVGILLAALGFVLVRAARRRRVAEREMEALQEQLRQSQKMEALGQLAGGVAHDFNNLLTAIIGHAELLRDGLPPDGAAMDDLNQIRSTAQRGAEMIRKLLMFGQRGRLELKPVRLAAIAGDLTAMLARLVPSNIKVIVSQQGDPVALGDRAALEQILVNLVTNARDAMPGGGELRITTMLVRLSTVEAARCGFGSGGQFACLEVRDGGTGMSPDTLARVFEPFFTTKPPGRGTGLGMAMVYSLMRRQHGGIALRSAPGEGTRVRLYLPCAEAPAPEVTPPARRTPAGSGRVLLAEDDAAVRAATARVLENNGYRVAVAEDGQAALDALRGAAFDLVLSDVTMPRLNGYQLCELARADGIRVPFIFISGYAEHPTAGRPPAGTAHLAKPWSADQLLALVREELERQPLG